MSTGERMRGFVGLVTAVAAGVFLGFGAAVLVGAVAWLTLI